MKINISRQNIYILLISLFLFVFVLFFSFLVLIPEGKDYRSQRLELKKEERKLRAYENLNDATYKTLKKLQSDHRNIITAFKNPFNAERFKKQNSKFFNSFEISKISQKQNENDFLVYEVNATSSIKSPKNFYNFLDSINKSDWIIGIDLPINFKRQDESIRSTFTMKVYKVPK